MCLKQELENSWIWTYQLDIAATTKTNAIPNEKDWSRDSGMTGRPLETTWKDLQTKSALQAAGALQANGKEMFWRCALINNISI